MRAGHPVGQQWATGLHRDFVAFDEQVREQRFQIDRAAIDFAANPKQLERWLHHTLRAIRGVAHALQAQLHRRRAFVQRYRKLCLHAGQRYAQRIGGV